MRVAGMCSCLQKVDDVEGCQLVKGCHKVQSLESLRLVVDIVEINSLVVVLEESPL